MIDLDQAFGGMNVEVGTSEHRVSWTLPTSLPYFAGHFPENPIFPAFGIVDASLYALGLVLDRSVEVDAISSAKFTQVLGPNEPIVISLTHEPTKDADDTWTIDWTVRSSAVTVATLTLSLRKDAPNQ